MDKGQDHREVGSCVRVDLLGRATTLRRLLPHQGLADAGQAQSIHGLHPGRGGALQRDFSETSGWGLSRVSKRQLSGMLKFTSNFYIILQQRRKCWGWGEREKVGRRREVKVKRGEPGKESPRSH